MEPCQPQKDNHYNILQIPPDATQSDIKKARDKLARQYHPDKLGPASEEIMKSGEEIMKKINEAFNVLNNAKGREKYDLDRDDTTDKFGNKSTAKRLYVGRKWSEDYIEKIDFWCVIGSKNEDTKFKNINTISNHDEVFDIYQTYTPFKEFRSFLNKEVPSIETIFSEIVPSDIWNRSFKKLSLIKKDVINSDFWVSELPPLGQQTKLEVIDADKCVKEHHTLLNTKPISFNFPDIKSIKSEIYNYYSSDIKKTFSSAKRHPYYTVIPLCPNTRAMKDALGFIPQHIVLSNKVKLITEATNCACCNSSFGLFLWKDNCMTCGNCHCSDCLKIQKSMDYDEPIKVCQGCVEVNQKKYAAEWVKELQNFEYYRKIVSSKYIAILMEFGFANKECFLQLSEIFFYEKRYDLSLQCMVYGNGNLLFLADKLLQIGNVALAKSCINFIKKDPQWWADQGDVYAILNPNLAILCYQNAQLTDYQYTVRAIKFSDHPISYSCVIAASKHLNTVDFFYSDFMEMLDNKKYNLGLFCAIQGNFSRDKWLATVNSVNIQEVEPFIKYYSTRFSIEKPTFHADRDHLRWQFLCKPDFIVWLDYLETQLKQHTGEYCIPYFRSMMKDENFIIHRDRYMAIGDYSKMLLCHRLAPQSIPFETLALKYQDKNELACLAACMCFSNNIEKTGDQYFMQGRTLLALYCYLQEGNYQKIQRQVDLCDSHTRLLYLLTLWKNSPENLNIILALCKELKTNPANAKGLQNIITGIIIKFKKEDYPQYFKLLLETGMEQMQLLGFLQYVATLQLSSEDHRWYDKALASFRSEFKAQLHAAIKSYSLISVITLSELAHPLTLPTILSVLKEFKLDELSRSPLKSICLVLRSLTNLRNPTNNKIFESMNDLVEAMLCDPTEESMEYYSQVMDKIMSFTPEHWKLRANNMCAIANPIKSEFTERLQRSPDLRLLIKSEDAIDKFKPFDAAMSYIDLCMALENSSGLVGGLLSASYKLLQAYHDENPFSNKSYAYRRAIVELVITVYTLGRNRFCPATQLYTVRSSIAILTSLFQGSNRITTNDQMLIEVLYKEADKLSKVTPLVMKRILSAFDLIYYDFINRDITTKYLDNKRKTNSDPMYQYYILEGTLGWMGQEKFTFEQERVNTMQALLQHKKYTMDQVEDLMSWPGIQRDNEGWLPSKSTSLNLSGKAYSRVYGIRFDINTGEISFLLEESKNKEDALITDNDISDIMKLGITGAQFSLDPPNSNMYYHPFQEMVYGPANLENTDYLATMLHADMLMKWLSMGTEVSGMAPFEMRDTEEGLLKRLPADLRKKFIELKNDIPTSAGKVHRFWLEGGKLKYFQNQENDVITYFIGDCKMKVRKHLMERDHDGKLVDAEKDDGNDTREAKFANLMTEEYPRLSNAFKELARLKELYKLQMLSIFAQSTHKNVQKASSKVDVNRDGIKEKLEDLRSQFSYPTVNNVDNLANECIRKNNRSQSQISWSELNKLKNEIRNQCITADNKRLDEVVTLLHKNYHAYNIKDLVKEWLEDGYKYDLITTLKESKEYHDKKRILQICDTFEKYGIATKSQDISSKYSCPWVPAAYKINDHSRVYGGADMRARLIPGGVVERSRGMNSTPPQGSGRYEGPNAKPYYTESMGSQGQLYGLMVGVDRVTGNTYRIVHLESCIRDKYTMKPNYPNVAALWRTQVGYTNVHHYTRHTNGAKHFHYTNGRAECTNAQGKVQNYKSGDKSHRCG